jgi:hypothetical protein
LGNYEVNDFASWRGQRWEYLKEDDKKEEEKGPASLAPAEIKANAKNSRTNETTFS